jgi:pheganomycin biosynthesis PGM1-like protein
MYGADPKFFHYGTKTGSRRLFAEEGVAHPAGYEDMTSVEDVVEALRRLRSERPSATHAIVKLNEGVSGEGNALVDLAGLPVPGDPGEAGAVEERVRAMSFESDGVGFDGYVAGLAENGGVVEERIEGDDFRSPSVQMRVTPLGELEILSTHDQLLGGPSGQSYLGCVFPADPGYAAAITSEAAKIGDRLAAEGVIGRFAVDFVAVSRGGAWSPYAIELNLRKGGTTHPFLTLQFLTDGSYDPEAALFTAPSGRPKFFVASDHIENPLYRSLTPDDLFDIVVRRGLHFDQARQTGAVFHMMSALGEHGRTGLTAVDETPDGAEALYRHVVEVLNEESAAG